MNRTPIAVEPWLNEAARAHDKGALEQAVTLYEKVLSLDPGHFTALNLLGVLKGQLGQPEEGETILRRALAVNPDDGDANANMGLMLGKLGRHAQALDHFTKAIEKYPERPGYMLNLAFHLVDFDKPDDAIDVANFLINTYPAVDRAHHAKANALILQSRYSEALEQYQIVLQRHDRDQSLWSNLGATYRMLKDFPQALRCHERALSLDPANIDARWERALTLLTSGDFEAGWKDYVSSKKERGLPSRPMLGKTWDGKADLRNKSIFVYREQGLGDVLQFCRFLHHLSKTGARVFFAPHDPLKWLMGTMGAGFEICDFADGELETDFHIPLLSLPAIFQSQPLPAQVPYLFPSQENVLNWEKRIGAEGFRIGICWQGSTGKADLGRSFPVRHFEGLSQIPGVRLISLHKGDGEGQLRSLPTHMNIETLGGDFDSGADGFFDAAAVMKSLDLVITSDTAMAHLAGALATPVWVALKSAPDWRWMTDRADNPWYPTMRLFRQSRAGDWAEVFEQMEMALREWLRRSSTRVILGE